MTDNHNEIREALAKMTPGEWRYTTPPDGYPIIGAGGVLVATLAHSIIYARQCDEALGNAAGIVILRNHTAELLADRDRLAAEVERLRAERDTPHIEDFALAVKLEAAHQRARWGGSHDAGKTPFDWFWLIGYLAQKAADAAVRGDGFKAMHHTISTAAALANWHEALAGGDVQSALAAINLLLERGYVPRPSVEDVERAVSGRERLAQKMTRNDCAYLVAALFPPPVSPRVQEVRKLLRVPADVPDSVIEEVLK